MILTNETLQTMIEKNDEMNEESRTDEFFDELYLKDRLRMKAELGLFIGQRVGHVVHPKKEKDEASIESGVCVLSKALTLVSRAKQADEYGYKHDDSNGFFDVKNYCSHGKIVSEYRELFCYHDTHLLVKLSELNSYRDLAGVIAGVLIILERIGVDETELFATFNECVKPEKKETINQ